MTDAAARVFANMLQDFLDSGVDDAELTEAIAKLLHGLAALNGRDEQPMRNYHVEIDGVMTEMTESSLAALCNKIRGCGKRIKVWSVTGLELIDTKFGDMYDLEAEAVEDHPDGNYRCQNCGHVDDADEFSPPEGRRDMCCPKCNSTDVWWVDDAEDCFVCTCHAEQGQPCTCKRPLTREQQIEKLLNERAK